MLSLLALLPLVSAATYPIAESWTGNGFLDGFNYDASFYDNTTNGDTFWARPGNDSLIYTSTAGTVILKVDNTTFVPYNEKRWAPKLLSKNAYGVGTVWVMDALHMPYGCSVWPAFWTQGPAWPLGGEIDIMEGVNQQTTNQIAVHGANTSCVADSSATMSGKLTQTQCANAASQGAGCTVVDPNENSYGAAFASAGGGVYVAELGEDGIRVWFFTRSAVPSALTADASSLDTGALGTPVAYYPSSTCNVDTFFGPQTLTINIALCGDWAGLPSILQTTCPALVGDQTCYTTYVINDGSATYANAYFELNYINIFSSATSADSSTPDTAASGSGTGSSASVTRSNAPTTTLTSGSTSRTSGAAAQSSGAAGPVTELKGVYWLAVSLAAAALGFGTVSV